MKRQCAWRTESSIVAARLVATRSLPTAMVFRSRNKICRIADSVRLPYPTIRQSPVAVKSIDLTTRYGRGFQAEWIVRNRASLIKLHRYFAA